MLGWGPGAPTVRSPTMKGRHKVGTWQQVRFHGGRTWVRRWALIASFFSLMLLPGYLPTAGATSSALLGVYYGGQGWHMDQVQAMEAWQGKRHAVVHVYTDWCTQSHEVDNFFSQQLP